MASCVGTVTVVVSTQDIPPNTELTPLIDGGVFRTEVLPIDAMVQGAVTSPEQLRGETTAAYVFQNEQIPIDRIQGIP